MKKLVLLIGLLSLAAILTSEPTVAWKVYNLTSNNSVECANLAAATTTCSTNATSWINVQSDNGVCETRTRTTANRWTVIDTIHNWPNPPASCKINKVQICVDWTQSVSPPSGGCTIRTSTIGATWTGSMQWSTACMGTTVCSGAGTVFNCYDVTVNFTTCTAWANNTQRIRVSDLHNAASGTLRNDYTHFEINYSTNPRWLTDPSDFGSSTATPTNVTDNITLTGTGTDDEADTLDLQVCSTNSTTGGACTATTICSSAVVNNGTQASCQHNTTGEVNSTNWFAFICDEDNLCSDGRQGSGNNASPYYVNVRPVITAVTNNGSVVSGDVINFTGTCSDANADTFKLVVCNATASTCDDTTSGANLRCKSGLGTIGSPWCLFTTSDNDIGTHSTDKAVCCDSYGFCNNTPITINSWTVNPNIILNTPTFSNSTDLDIGKNNPQDNATVTCDVTCTAGSCSGLTIGIQYNNGSWNNIPQSGNQAVVNRTNPKSCGVASSCSEAWQIEGLNNATYSLRCNSTATTPNDSKVSTTASLGIYTGNWGTFTQTPSATQQDSIYDNQTLSGSLTCVGPSDANFSCGSVTLTAREGSASPTTTISASTPMKLISGTNPQSAGTCWSESGGSCSLTLDEIAVNVTYGDGNGITRYWDMQASSTDPQVAGTNNGADVAIVGNVGNPNVTITSTSQSGSPSTVCGSIEADVGCDTYRCANITTWAIYNVSSTLPDTNVPYSGNPFNVTAGTQPQNIAALEVGSISTVNWTIRCGSSAGVWRYSVKVNSTVSGVASTNSTQLRYVTITSTPTPDLIVLSNEDYVNITPQPTYVGTNVTVNGTVINSGTGDSGAFNLTFFVDGALLCENRITTLVVDANTTRTCYWTATAGTHNITVASDYRSEISELFETNNNGSRLFTIVYQTQLAVSNSTPANADVNISFTANYTYINSTVITGATCEIWFNDTQTDLTMYYNASSLLYNYNRTFGGGDYDWNVTCQKASHDTKTSTGSLRVYSPGASNTGNIDNCGGVYYTIKLYNSTDGLFAADTVVEVSNSTSLVNSTSVPSYDLNWVNSIYQGFQNLSTTADQNEWSIKAIASNVKQTGKFIVGAGSLDVWKVDTVFIPNKITYNRSLENITVNFTVYNQKGEGVSGLWSSNITLFRDTTQIVPAVTDRSKGKYNFTLDISPLSTGSHYLEITAWTTPTLNVTERKSFSVVQ